jgi:hypothetical protein
LLTDDDWKDEENEFTVLIVFQISLQFLVHYGLTNKSGESDVTDGIEVKGNQFLKAWKIKLKQREHLDYPAIKPEGAMG